MSRRRHRSAGRLALACGLMAAAGCGGGHQPPSPDVVATISGRPIGYPEFVAYLEQHLGDPGRGLPSDVLSRLFDQFLDERLLTLLAVDRGLVPADAGRRAALDRLLAASGSDEPAEAEIAAYYATHPEKADRPDRVRLRQILFEDRAVAEQALAEIRAGGDFAAVALRLEEGEGAAEGTGATAGGVQELAREDLPPAYADIVFRLAPGEVSDVVEAAYGFHLFQVVERLPAARLPLTEVQREIRDRLRLERTDQTLTALVAEARSRYDVEVYERNLPFNYQGLHIADPH